MLEDFLKSDKLQEVIASKLNVLRGNFDRLFDRIPELIKVNKQINHSIIFRNISGCGFIQNTVFATYFHLTLQIWHNADMVNILMVVS